MPLSSVVQSESTILEYSSRKAVLVLILGLRIRIVINKLLLDKKKVKDL